LAPLFCQVEQIFFLPSGTFFFPHSIVCSSTHWFPSHTFTTQILVLPRHLFYYVTIIISNIRDQKIPFFANH
jgi:hypothetical protein